MKRAGNGSKMSGFKDLCCPPTDGRGAAAYFKVWGGGGGARL